MSCKFSFFLSFTDARRETDVGVFHSDSGDVYKVKYKSNICRDLILRIDWTIPKKILFAVKLYSASFRRCLSSKGMIVSGKKAFMKLRGAFNVSNSRDYKMLCVVSLIPYIKFNNNSELPTELFNETEFLQSEQSSVDDNSVVSDEEIRSRNEVVDYTTEVRNKSMTNINEINLTKENENSQSVSKMVHASCKETDYKFETISPTDEMIIEQSIGTNSEIVVSDNTDGNVSRINQSSSIYQADKMIENDNAFESSLPEHDSINIKNFENNFTKIIEDLISGNSDEQRHEFQLSDSLNLSFTPNSISAEENTVSRSNTNEPKLITKLLTLDDSEEIIENVKTINFHEIVKSIDRFSENNFSIDLNLLESSYKCPTSSSNEDKYLCSSDTKAEVSFSKNIFQEISRRQETEFHIVSENVGMRHFEDVVESHIKSDSTKTNFVLESKDVSVKADYDKDADILSKCNIQAKNQDSDSSKLENAESLIFLKSCTSSVNTINSSKLKTPEIKNAIVDSHKLEYEKISSSKSDLIFHSLVHKLYEADCDPPSKGVETDIDRISGKSLQIPRESESDNNKNFPVMESELKGLSMDMLDLLFSGDMVDSEITNGEKHVKVHRAILSARSSKLKKIFVRHMNYSAVELNYRAVVNIPSDILEDVVIFLYVGLIYIKSSEMLQDLYQVAERYSISDLIDICLKHM